MRMTSQEVRVSREDAADEFIRRRRDITEPPPRRSAWGRTLNGAGMRRRRFTIVDPFEFG
jgi:hypothetical protein